MLDAGGLFWTEAGQLVDGLYVATLERPLGWSLYGNPTAGSSTPVRSWELGLVIEADRASR